MEAGDLIATINLGASRTAYTYEVVGRGEVSLGVSDSVVDGQNVSAFPCSTQPVGCDVVLRVCFPRVQQRRNKCDAPSLLRLSTNLMDSRGGVSAVTADHDVLAHRCSRTWHEK